MDDWLRNMGDWNISRKRYFGLPLPFYPCECGAPERDRLARRARGARDCAGSSSCRSSTGPGSTRCRSAASRAARRCSASPRSATPGSTRASSRFSTLGWENAESVPHGYATGAAQGLTGADLPDHAYWEKWFPADWVSEMREQIRLWFYSQFFMAVTLVGRSPYRRVLTYEKLLDENGRRDAPLVGQRDRRERRVRRMGADVMRWLFCEQPAGPEPEVRLRAGATRSSAACSRSGTRSRSSSPTRTSRSSPRPTTTSRAGRPTRSRSTPGSSRGRGSSSREATEAYERYWTPGGHACVRVVRRRPLELVHPPFAAPLLTRPTTPRSGRSGMRSPRRCA